MRVLPRIRRAFLAAFVVAAIASPVIGADWPRWAREAAALPLLEGFDDAEAVVLLDAWEVELNDGARIGRRRWLLRVLSEEGREHAVFGLARGSFDDFSRVKVWVRSPRGEVTRLGEREGLLFSTSSRLILDDSEVLVLRPRGVVTGSLMAVEYHFRSEPDIPQDVFRVQRDVPVVRARVSLTNRWDSWRVRALVAAGENPGPEVAEGNAVWEFRDLPAQRGGQESYAPIPPRVTLALDYLPVGGAAPFVDWGTTALWAQGLFALPEEEQPRLEAAVALVTDRGGDPVEEAGRLVRELRYFGIEIGWGGMVPRPPELTLERAFGDCKDKSHLMVALLRRIGIEAYPVLTSAPTDRHVYEDLPGPRQFNHCVVGIPWEGRERGPGMTFAEAPGLGEMRIYDPTLSDASPQDVSMTLEGAAGLVVDEATTGLLRMSTSTAAENVVHSRYRITIGSRGESQVTVDEEASGALRTALEGEEGDVIAQEELREVVFREAARRCPAFSELRVSSPERQETGTWTYSLAFFCPEALADFGDLQVLDLFPHHGIPGLPVPGDGDEESIFWPLLASFKESYGIEYPGYRLVSHPADMAVENELGSVTVGFRETEEGLALERELVIATIEIAPEARENAEALDRALRRANRLSLVLEKMREESE